jgi:hypothetical protein
MRQCWQYREGYLDSVGAFSAGRFQENVEFEQSTAFQLGAKCEI